VVIFAMFIDATDVHDNLNKNQDLIEVKPHKTKLVPRCFKWVVHCELCLPVVITPS